MPQSERPEFQAQPRSDTEAWRAHSGPSLKTRTGPQPASQWAWHPAHSSASGSWGPFREPPPEGGIALLNSRSVQMCLGGTDPQPPSCERTLPHGGKSTGRLGVSLVSVASAW